ncbi:MAG: C4-dicarboxylate ABC transporter substrate-binding protein, partial [Pseudomonadota bacterium]
CLTGNGDCPAGDARSMTLVEVSDADFEKARGVLVGQVLPDWAERAGGTSCAKNARLIPCTAPCTQPMAIAIM